MPLVTQYPFDAQLQFKDAGAVTADGAATVSAAAKIVDVGDAAFLGEMVIDVSAIDVASTDEGYLLIVEGCNTADFTTGSPEIQPLAILALGAAAAIPGAGATSSPTGRYPLLFRNQRGSTVFRYLRMYHDVSGTTPSINYTAYAAPLKANA